MLKGTPHILALLLISAFSFLHGQQLLPDSTFGINGKVTTAIDGYNVRGQAVAVQTDGRIVVAAMVDTVTSTDGYFGLIRFLADGTLDNSFGRNGIVLISINYFDEAQAIVIQPDGKIIVGGATEGGTLTALVRYQTNGALDKSFGNNGIQIAKIEQGVITSLALQPDGKIIAGGWSYNYNPNYSVSILEQCNPNGSADNSFGTNGIVYTDFGSESDFYSLAIQPDGKIVAGGNNNAIFAIARYTKTGLPDSSFAVIGKITFRVGNGGCRSVALQADGKLVVGGQGSTQFELARCDTDGQIDLDFGLLGQVLTPLGDAPYPEADCYSVLVLPNGQIVAAGSAINNTTDFGLILYNGDGSVSSTITTDFGNEDYALSSTLQPDGKIVAVGYTSSNTQNTINLALARYSAGLSLAVTNMSVPVNITLYPNPTTGPIYFKGVQPGNTLQVYNLLGEEIYSSTITHDNYNINLSGKAKGMYFYSITNNTTLIQQGKIVVE